MPQELQAILQNPIFARAHLEYLGASVAREAEAGFTVYAGNATIRADSINQLVPFEGNFQERMSVNPGQLASIQGMRPVALYHTHWRPQIHNIMVNFYAGPAPQDITALRTYMGNYPAIQDGFVGHFNGVHTFIPGRH
jgi:hypothetical protein